MDEQEHILRALERSADSASQSSSSVGDVYAFKDDEKKTKKDLIKELRALRRQLAETTRRQNSPVINDERASVQQLQDMFQTIIDTIPVSIWWKDKDSRFLGCNMKIAEAAGFSSPSDLIGKTDYDCPWKKEESDWFVEWDRKVMETNRPHHHIIEPKLTADGKQAWLDTTKVPLHDPDGNVIGTLGTYEDITERKQAEIELQRAHEELNRTHAELQEAHALLEERVRERTRALEVTNAQLQELSDELMRARDQAMEASRYKSNFLANMSHEIRTPLNSVVAITELMLKTKLDRDQQEFVDIIQNSSKALQEIVQDILDFSKIEAGKAELVMEDFDLRAVAESVMELLGPKAEEKKLTLTTRFEGQLPLPLRGDCARLRQILINLTSNAIKFTHSGAVELLIESKVFESSGDGNGHKPGNYCYLRFTVNDTGIGLSETTAAKIFEPFTQADGSITRRFGGTGLGLSICRELVQLMGGQIGVESTEGVGSKFWFAVELQPADSFELIDPKTADTARVQRARISREANVPMRKGVVLVADDSPLNRKVAVLVLQHLGLTSHAVSNGQEAIDAMQTGSYDLILMDCQMPVLDGFESARRIREMQNGTALRTPIVALTAQAIDGDREKCLDAGMDDYITKPITPDRLAQKLQRWLPSHMVQPK